MHYLLFIYFNNKPLYLEVSHLRCVCENWKGHVVKHNYAN